MTPTPTTECAPETIKQHATTLKLHGLLAHWDELTDIQLTWVDQWLQWETRERQQRGLQRRLHAAHLGRFKPLADFDWNWPKHCDKATVSTLMRLDFIAEALNVILVGPNGVGKTLIAQNLAYQAIMQGHSAVFVNAAQLLGDLAAQDGDSGLRRRFAHYARPDVLVIDEIGYLSYGTRHADLLFEIINRRYERKPTIITTNRPFAEWSEVSPMPPVSCPSSIALSIMPRSWSSKASPTACARPKRALHARRKKPGQRVNAKSILPPPKPETKPHDNVYHSINHALERR
jgi:DNA replication protein DnaC